MGGEWRETTLDQLGRIVTGKTPPSGEMGYFDGDIPFVTPTDLDGRRIIDSTERYLTDQGAATVGGSRIPYQAVMVSCIGSDMGKAAVSGRECVTNQQINSVIVDSDDDPLFVYYNLSTRKAEIRAAAGGSAQPILNKSAFGRFDIYLPPPAEQRAIAHILGTLDDKIELNRRRNQTLEAMARALFKDWFVDFGPVRAKMNLPSPAGRWAGGEGGLQGKPYLPADLWQLFPDRLDDEGKPEGWEKKRISEYLSLAYGKSLPAGNRHQGGVPVYGSGGITGFHSEALVNGPVAIVGRKGTVGSLYWEDRPCFPIDTVFYVQPTAPLPFCYYLLESLPLRDMNTDAAVPGLNRENVYRLEVAAPPAELIAAFAESASLLRHSIAAISRDSETLAQLRDTLLPKLISGELRIADAVRFLETRP